MAPLLKFTVLRFALFFAALAVLALAGARGWLLLVLAAVVSLALSYVLLRGPRNELAAAIAQKASSRTQRDERDEDVEDSEADATWPAERNDDTR